MPLLVSINVLGIALGMPLALTLWLRKTENVEAHRLLAGLIAACCHVVLVSLLYATGLIVHAPHLVGTQSPMIFAFGPLLYLFFRTYGRLGRRLQPRDLLHALPFALYVIYLLPIYLLPAEIKVDGAYGALVAGGERYQDVQLWHSVLGLTHIGAYLAAGWRIVVRRGPRWLRLFALALIALGALAVGRFALETLTPVTTFETVLVVPTALALFVSALGFVALRQSNAFTDEQEPPPYARSAVSPDEARSLQKQLLHTMEEERPYLDPDLGLPELAARLDVSPHAVSQVLNAEIGERFNAFVNRYRVEAAQHMLCDPDCSHLSVSAIALEAGFGSRSTFYSAFRAHAGCTPTEYARARSET